MKSKEDAWIWQTATETGMRRPIRASAPHHYSFIWSCGVCCGCGCPTVAFFSAGEFKPEKAGPSGFNGLSCRSWRWRERLITAVFFLSLFLLSFLFLPHTSLCPPRLEENKKVGMCGTLLLCNKTELKTENTAAWRPDLAHLRGACVNICVCVV